MGLADLTGARILAEIGDDRTRFDDARALKAFAGSAPVTKASGRSVRITYRHVKNNRLAAVGFLWPFIAAGCESPTRAHYLARHDHGDPHPAGLRHLLQPHARPALPLLADRPSLRPDQGIQAAPAPSGMTIRRASLSYYSGCSPPPTNAAAVGTNGERSAEAKWRNASEGQRIRDNDRCH